ncbi:MAG: DMT family protein [Bacteroidetes bacterium]|nr:DMT family protein [Bacteroidota bacterium]MDA1199989.1 DMT family protein [Bacteroidota bacterium]
MLRGYRWHEHTLLHSPKRFELGTCKACLNLAHICQISASNFPPYAPIEVIALEVFVFFALLYLKEPFQRKHAINFGLLIAAVVVIL